MATIDLPLTAVTLSIHKMSADKIFDPEWFTNASSGRLLAPPVTRAGVLAFQSVQFQNFEVQNVLAGFQLCLKGGHGVEARHGHLSSVRQTLLHQEMQDSVSY